MSSTPEVLAGAEADKIVSIMADQQEEFAKFRENANARIARLERIANRKSSSPMDWDFARIANFGLALIFALVVARVLIAALAYSQERKNKHGNVSVSQA